jgi:hypothetical protein
LGLGYEGHAANALYVPDQLLDQSFLLDRHHRIFGYIRAHDGVLLRIKSVFLLWVVMVSFSASMIMEYGDNLEEGRQAPETGRMILLPTDEHR